MDVSQEQPAPGMGSSLFTDVEAWTEDTLQALNRLKLASSTASIRGTSVSLAIPLDADDAVAAAAPAPVVVKLGDIDEDGGVPLLPGNPPLLRRKTSRRDSMRRREALLKGNEGSRRRQKWENDRLIGNPYAQPPLPVDWEVHPTHPVHTVPYYLAPLWDAKRAEEERRARKNKLSRSADDVRKETTGRVPKGLKETIKRSRAAKHLLQELEEDIRKFVENYNENKEPLKIETTELDRDDDDFAVVDEEDLADSYVFLRPEMLVFDSPENDQNAGFGRYLVHSLGAYYGLDTWSVTSGNPARREAYVGIKDINPRRRITRRPIDLPLPMWTRV